MSADSEGPWLRKVLDDAKQSKELRGRSLPEPTGSVLHDAAQRLREYLESPACVLPGLDVPDEIWIPFTTALDAQNAPAERRGNKPEA